MADVSNERIMLNSLVFMGRLHALTSQALVPEKKSYKGI